MKTALIILIFIIGAAVLILRTNKKSNKNISIPIRDTDFMKEWRKNVSEAELNREIYLKTDDHQKYNLLNYYIYKLLGKNSFHELPTALKVFHMIEILEAQVNNGGIHQLFTNSSGQHIPDILWSLECIKADRTKLILEKAIRVMLSHGETPELLNKELQKTKLKENISSK